MHLYDHSTPLYGIQLIELEKFLPFLTPDYNDNYIQNNRYEMTCFLCNKKCNKKFKEQHIHSKKHQFNICKLNALRNANIQQFLSRNVDYIDARARNNISVSPININNEGLEVNPHFLCPISMEIMKEPVLAADGHTYDKSSIQKWFETKKTSPITNLKIDTIITPNIVLHKLIEESL